MKLCNQCGEKLGETEYAICKICLFKLNRFERWGIPFEIELKYKSICKKCGAYITIKEIEDLGGYCLTCFNIGNKPLNETWDDIYQPCYVWR